MTPAEATIDAYFEAIRRKDAEDWIACFAADAVVRDPADSPERMGEAAHRAFFAGIADLFAELDFSAERRFHRGDAAAVYFRARCVTRDGRTLEAEGIDMFEFDPAGKVRRLTGYWDPAPLLASASGTGPGA